MPIWIRWDTIVILNIEKQKSIKSTKNKRQRNSACYILNINSKMGTLPFRRERSALDLIYYLAMILSSIADHRDEGVDYEPK